MQIIKIITEDDFLKMDDKEKHLLISEATKLGLTEQLTKECLIAMLIYQGNELDEAYEAFCYEQAAEVGNFDEN